MTTSGALGGWMQPGGPYTAAPVPGSREDTYGCGDSFMAGLTFALGPASRRTTRSRSRRAAAPRR